MQQEKGRKGDTLLTASTRLSARRPVSAQKKPTLASRHTKARRLEDTKNTRYPLENFVPSWLRGFVRRKAPSFSCDGVRPLVLNSRRIQDKRLTPD